VIGVLGTFSVGGEGRRAGYFVVIAVGDGGGGSADAVWAFGFFGGLFCGWWWGLGCFVALVCDCGGVHLVFGFDLGVAFRESGFEFDLDFGFDFGYDFSFDFSIVFDLSLKFSFDRGHAQRRVDGV